MKRRLLKYLVCPECRKGFGIKVSEGNAGEIVTATLVCSGCGKTYPVVGGVPRILRRLSGVERRTAAAFGYEWKNFREHYGYYEAQFLSWIHPIKPDFFRGKVVLDAGCGMGRNMYYAAKYGSKDVIGVDLSEAVDAAYQLVKDLPNAHVVQCDIYSLPFRQPFDYVFSIGVLHHLPSPTRGFGSLLAVLKRGGTISVWVYGKEGNFLVRTVGSFIRVNVTSKLPHGLLKALCYPLAGVLHVLAKYIYKPLGFSWLPYGKYFIALADFDFRNKLSIIFDHLVPPIAFYISRAELKGWFSASRLHKVIVSSRYDNSWRGVGVK